MILPAGLALLLIALFALGMGWLWIRPFLIQKSFAGDWLALGMVSITVGTIFIGVVALILVEFKIYSLPLLGILCVLTIFILALIGWRQKAPLWPQITAVSPAQEQIFTSPRWEKVVLLLWFVAALWLFFRPHQFIHGGADAGVYVNLAAQIDRIGSIVFQDETFAQLDPAVQAIFARPISNPIASSYLLPAFYLTDVANGQVEPQFYPFHPVWQAIAYGLGGLTAALLLNGLWTLLSCLAIYLFVRELVGWETAVLALVALSLSAMQVWFARYPTTEMQTQFFLWVGFWATAVWLKKRQPTSLWAFVAGSSLGVIFLVRIDVIFMLPILLAFITWFWATKRKGTVWFAVPLLLLVLHSLIYALTQSRPYFFELYNFGVRSIVKNQGVLAGLIVVGLFGLWVVAKYHLGIQKLFIRYRKLLLGTVVLFLLLFAGYNWFIRPYNVDILYWTDQFSTNAIGKYDHENLIRLGWYLSPLGILLGFLGICWLVWRVSWETAVMLSITLFFTLFYLWNIRNNPHQIYAMRRYVPAVLPLFIVATAYLLDTLIRQRQRWLKGVALILAAAWLLGIIWSARGFISQVDYATVPAQLAELNAQLVPNSIIIFQEEAPVGVGDFVGTPLRFLFGHDVYKIYNSEAPLPAKLVETIEGWQNNGRTVYWVGNPEWLAANNLPYRTQITQTISSQSLEGVYERKPSKIVTNNWQIQLSIIDPSK